MVYIHTNQKTFFQDEDQQTLQLPLSIGSTHSSNSDTFEVFNENHLLSQMGLTCVESEEELVKYLPENLLNNFKKTYLAKRSEQEASPDSSDEPSTKRQRVEPDGKQ
jgi:hypothetical protein